MYHPQTANLFLSVRFITKNILNQRILLHWAGTDYANVINTYDRVVTNKLAGHAFGIPTLDISSNRSATDCVYMHVTFKTTEHFDCLSAWILSCFRQSILQKLQSFKDKQLSILYINQQLLCTDYYLFIKYYSPLYVSSLKCSSSGGYSCTHAAYGTVTLYESSWWQLTIY